MVAEYSTIVETTQPRVSYLTSDHLGSPRITTDKDGDVYTRRDFMPFGEEIDSDDTSQRTAGLNYASDEIRQKFTSYERDNETELDFAQARMHNYNLGRFTSPDPLYFQVKMTANPQRFNLYVYSINNPLKWTDPNGEEVTVASGSSIDEIYIITGGKDEFEKYFQITDGQVILQEGVSLDDVNEGVKFLSELVKSADEFLIYLGDDSKAVAKLFEGTTDKDGNLNETGKFIAGRFKTEDVLYGTRGRLNSLQPAGSAFAVIAINPKDFDQTQISIGGVNYDPFNEGVPEVLERSRGIGEKVKPESLLIHELAENLDFSRNGVASLGNKFASPSVRAKFSGYNEPNYQRSHNYAIKREAKIRRSLNLTGGFAGGGLRRN
jgi:RHS repeat-associated protein